MVTINQYLQMYDLVFEGKQVEYYGLYKDKLLSFDKDVRASLI